jgi:hypothetical protein
MVSHPNRSRYGRRVQIIGGIAEFVGKIGTIIDREGMLLRVRLDEPVDVPGIGLVIDDLWEPRLLKTAK